MHCATASLIGSKDIHALVDALGNPVEVMLIPGQDHDLTWAEPLIEALSPGALIADKAFDARHLHHHPQRSSDRPSLIQIEPKNPAHAGYFGT
jgi:hypothetical protein